MNEYKNRVFPTNGLEGNMDDRMAAQQTVFTLLGDLERTPDDLTDKTRWPEVLTVPNMGGSTPGDLLRANYQPYQIIQKIRLPASWREHGLASLARMGVSAGTLFPGLDGVGQAARLALRGGGDLEWRELLNQ